MDFYFAPLQGYTDYHYRNVHHRVVGGMTGYFTPFVRYEGGGMRAKDVRDLLPENNDGVPTIPQVIASSRDEFCFLCDKLQAMGWQRIDLNMGCPFPLQTGRGRGCALMSHPDQAEAVIRAMDERKEVSFSVKMRLGYASSAESLVLMPMINDSAVRLVTIHPRIGSQQYRGTVDMEGFDTLASQCRKPLIYNGDITTEEQMAQMGKRYPHLQGIMIGRGLLARPTLVRDYLQLGQPMDGFATMMQMHDALLERIERNYCGDSQILSRMRAFWEYQSEAIPRKAYKQMMKCGSLRNYLRAYEAMKTERL